MEPSPTPAAEGWFEIGSDGLARLVGTRCSSCATVRFPPAPGSCPNPSCRSRSTEPVPLSRTGTVWSYTDARYQPPPPFVPATDPFEPFAIAAVELAAEQMVVLGQVAAGFGVDDLAVGMPVELVVEPLHVEDGRERLIWRWKPLDAEAGASAEGTAA